MPWRSRSVRFRPGLAWLVALAALPNGARADLASDLESRLASSEAPVRIATLKSLAGSGIDTNDALPLLSGLVDDPSVEVRGELVRTIETVLGERGVELLAGLAKDGARSVRLAAVRTTCRMWQRPAARKVCAGEFDGGGEILRIQVIETLRQSFPRDPAAAALFRRGLSSDSTMVQRASVFGSQAARDPKAVAILYEVARTAPDLAAVPAAEEALATIATDEAIESLIALLPRPAGTAGRPGWPSPGVRAAAARALARLNTERARPQLRALLRDPEVELVLAALEGLQRMRDALSVGAVARLLEHPDELVRRSALRVLRQLGDPSCAAKVRGALSGDVSAEVRAAAVLSLIGLVGENAIPDLRRLAADPDARVRLDAVGALAGLGAPAAPALSAFLRDEVVEVRSLAVRGLAQTGDSRSFAFLAESSPFGAGSDVRLRIEYARVLGELNDDRAVSLLARYAEDSDERVRERAAASLGKISATSAVPILERLTRDPNPRVGEAARRALATRGSR